VNAISAENLIPRRGGHHMGKARRFQSHPTEQKPEAAYFIADGGKRTGFPIVNMEDASQLAGSSEPWFPGPTPVLKRSLAEHNATLRFAGAFRTGESACPTFFQSTSNEKRIQQSPPFWM